MMSSSAMKSERRMSLASHSTLIDNFNNKFSVVTADTIALQEQAHRLRYQVYCIENNFENPLDHPMEQEIDEYDTRSVHSVVIDRPTKAVTATVRIILPDPDAFANSFPIQKVCSHPMLQNHMHTNRSAEISRFAVSKEICRRSADHQPLRRQTDSPNVKRSSMPNITLGLMNGIVRMSAEHGITEWFAVMEPSLLRLLARFGIYFSPIGAMVDYHGMRQPCHANINNLLGRVRKERLDVWEIITDNGWLLDRENLPFPSKRLMN